MTAIRHSYGVGNDRRAERATPHALARRFIATPLAGVAMPAG
ncbi:hypothetical protein [Burkholderia sp. BCC1972]|nr:hypothetical protein [Burkholderia sp. BCC1972]